MLSKVTEFQRLVAGLGLEDSLRVVAQVHGARAAFSTSLGLEDQLITHTIFSLGLPIRVFTLDTGRLFPESLDVLEATRVKYGRTIEVFAPVAEAVQELVSRKGPFSFRRSVEERKECCRIRKVEPLARALRDVDVWVTGIRADQATTRQDLPAVEWDEGHGLLKWHPLLRWSLEDVKGALQEHAVPVNALHAAGFPSIGCQPCTRAVKPGEDVRAGRWWWEAPEQKECGLHFKDGRAVRAKSNP